MKQNIAKVFTFSLLASSISFISCVDNEKNLFDADQLKQIYEETFPVKNIDLDGDWTVSRSVIACVSVNGDQGVDYKIQIFDADPENLDLTALAVECVHSYSLIHDDLPCMDNDEYRRGKLTTWKAYGYDMAVLAGDALMIYAFETASKAFSMGADPAKVGRAIGILAEKTGIYGMIGGQTVDVELTGKAVPREKLDFIYRLKTGALLEASMMIGAVLAGATVEEIKEVETMASEVGLAFQIQDDILDVTSTQ